MIPELLYKYRSCLNDFDFNLIKYNELYFCSASSFNDPFDCDIIINYESLNKDYIIKRNISYLKYAKPELNRQERRRLAREQEKNKLYKDPEHLASFNKFQKEYNANNFGICSLSEQSENIVMWSHYSNSHKGICVGLDSKQLLDSFESIYEKEGHLLNIYKVNYNKEYPSLHIMDFEEKDTEEQIIKPLIIKSDYWKYEKEYRIISTTGTNIAIRFSDNIIKEILLGVKISKDIKDKITEILKNKKSNTKLFQAKKSDNKFGIDFQELKYLL